MKFSIGIPAYKSSYLKDCINSILNQTFKDFELIIVNDASPEDLDSIINNFDDHRIRYYKNLENLGAENVISNWNKCLNYSIGDYFILFGDDDLMTPDYLMEFNLLIEKYPHLEVFHCRSMIINEASNIIKITPSLPEFETVYDSIWHRLNNYRYQFISDFVYETKSLKDQNGFYYLPLAWASDDITAYIITGKKGIAHTNKPLLKYRNSILTITNTGKVDLKLKAIEKEKEWLIRFLENSSCSGFDQILKEEILSHLSVYFQKKRLETLYNSYNNKFIRNIKSSFNNLIQKNISLTELSLVIYRITSNKLKFYIKFLITY